MAIMSMGILEDKTEDLVHIKGQLKKIVPESEIRVFRNEDQLVRELKLGKRPCHVLFVALNEPDCRGLQTVRRMREKGFYTPVIFVCENGNYRKEAFEVYASNYLIKPAKDQEVEHALYPLRRTCAPSGKGQVHFQYRSQIYTIGSNEINYISSSLHTVSFHLTDGSTLACRGKLSEFEEQLKNCSFLRCHQSFLLNMEKVTARKKDSFLLGEDIVPVSRTYAQSSWQKYEEWLKRGQE